MRLSGNIIWLVFGEILVSIGYLLAAIPLMITLIGIPFGIQAVKLALPALWPFGRTVRDRENSGGCLYLTMNIIWLVFGGLEICLLHLLLGLLFCITIIGIPFGRQHFKLAALALTPFGKDVG